MSAGGPLRSYLTGSPGRPDPGEQTFEVGQARERLAELKAVLGSQDAKQAAGLGEGSRAVPDTPRIASEAWAGARVTAAREPSESATMTVRW